MSETDLYRIAARMKWPGATITGSGAWAIVRSFLGKATTVVLFPTATEAGQEQSRHGGEQVRITPAPASYRPTIRCGYGDDD